MSFIDSLPNFMVESHPDPLFAEALGARLGQIGANVARLGNLVEKESQPSSTAFHNNTANEVQPYFYSPVSQSIGAAAQNVVSEALIQHDGEKLTDAEEVPTYPQSPAHRPVVTEAQQIVDAASQHGAEHIADEAEAFLQQQPMSQPPTSSMPTATPEAAMSTHLNQDEIRQRLDQVYADGQADASDVTTLRRDKL